MKSNKAIGFGALACVLSLGACAVPPPSGPSVMALPGQGKDFATFQQDDASCRQYAFAVSGGGAPSQAAAQNSVGSAVVGTALGAAAGAVIGAAAGNPGAGAAIGAGSGLVLGSAAGANNAYASGAGAQQSYDIGYTQCMYGRGNTVQSAPGYPVAAYPAYGYPAYAGGYYGPAYVAGPTVAFGFGGGWGGGWGWHHGWDHDGWHGGGWHGGGWHH